MQWQIWQDPELVSRFTDRRRGGLLGGAVQTETLLRLLSVVASESLTVLDLGCGDGVLLETVLEARPGARGIALDGSPAMLEKARMRLGENDNVMFIEADFNTPDWRAKLPYPTYDAVVSGFAIHHSEDKRKRALYEEIYGLLNPGGVFVNIEHVASASARGERFFEEAFAENVARFRQSRGEKVTTDQALAEMRTRPDKAANRLASVETHLAWLREIGFVDVDCYWKHFELALLAGYR